MSFEKFKEQWLKQVMADKELPLTAFHLCFVISTYMNRKEGGEAYPSLETLAREAGMSRRWVIVLTKHVEDRGHLEIRRSRLGRKNVSNRYRPRLHQGSELVTSLPSEVAASPRSELATAPEPLNEPQSEPLKELLRGSLKNVSTNVMPNGRQNEIRGVVREGVALAPDAHLYAIGSDRPPTKRYGASESLSEAIERLQLSMSSARGNARPQKAG